MYRRPGKGLRQGEDIGGFPHIFLLGILQRLLEGGAGFEPHPPRQAGLLGPHQIDGRGVPLGQVPAADHRKAVEGMERIGVAVPADILPVGGIVLPQPAKVGQGLHAAALVLLVERGEVGPERLVHKPVAGRRANDNAAIAHHPLMADNLRGKRLHEHDGVGAHPVAVVEGLGHTEDQHVVFFLRPGDVGAPVGHLPTERLDRRRIAGKNRYLPGIAVEHRIAAEKLFPHPLLHVHPDLIELGAHQAPAAHRHKFGPVHDAWHMVGGDAPPVGDPGGAVLITARIAPVGVPLGMSDQHGDVGVVDIFVHDYRVPARGEAQVDEVVPVLAVMVDDLPAVPEFIEERLAQNAQKLLLGVFPVQAVGAEEQDVPLLHPGGVKLLEDDRDAHLAMRAFLLPALHPVGEDDDAFGALMSQL